MAKAEDTVGKGTPDEQMAPDEIPTTEEFYEAAGQVLLTNGTIAADHCYFEHEVELPDGTKGKYKLDDYFMFDATDIIPLVDEPQDDRWRNIPQDQIPDEHKKQKKQLLQQNESILQIRLYDKDDTLLTGHSYFLFRKGRLEKNRWFSLMFKPNPKSTNPSPIPEEAPDDQILIVRMGERLDGKLVNPAETPQLLKIHKTFSKITGAK